MSDLEEKQETTVRTIRFSVARVKQEGKNKYYPDITTVTSIDELKKVAERDHVAGLFKDNQRSKKNFLEADCVIMDCDNDATENQSEWLTPEKMHERLSDVEFYIIYSKSNNKQKDSYSPRPRFHIYFPLSETITEEKEIRVLKERILRLCPEFDADAKDTARLIFGVDNPDGLYFSGSKVINDVLPVEENIKKSSDISDTREVKKTDIFRGINFSIADIKQSKTKSIYRDGERNSNMSKYAFGVLMNFTIETAMKKFQAESTKCQPPLDAEELNQIWNSALNSEHVQLRIRATELIKDYEGDFISAKEIFDEENADADFEIQTEAWATAIKLAQRGRGKSNGGFNGRGREEKKPITLGMLARLIEEMKITLRMNAISGRVEVSGIPENSDYTTAKFATLKSYKKKETSLTALRLFLYTYIRHEIEGYTVTQQLLDDMLGQIALENEYNPVAEMLMSVKWDGQDRLNELFEIMGISENPLYRTYVAKWLHQGVAMAFNDEGERSCDFVLTVQGLQGMGKTECSRRLAIKKEWFKEGATIDVRIKDTLIETFSYWITELGEVDGTLKREQAELKSIITANFTEFRRPYAKVAERRPRRTNLIATVNDERFLLDTTGGTRRWAVVRIKKIDHNKLRSLPEEWFIQLWKQVHETMYLVNPEGYRLTETERIAQEKENKSATVYKAGEQELYECLDWSRPVIQWRWWSASEFIKKTEIRNLTAQKVGKAMKKIAENDERIQYREVNHTGMYLLPPEKNLGNDNPYERDILYAERKINPPAINEQQTEQNETKEQAKINDKTLENCIAQFGQMYVDEFYKYDTLEKYQEAIEARIETCKKHDMKDTLKNYSEILNEVKKRIKVIAVA